MTYENDKKPVYFKDKKPDYTLYLVLFLSFLTASIAIYRIFSLSDNIVPTVEPEESQNQLLSFWKKSLIWILSFSIYIIFIVVNSHWSTLSIRTDRFSKFIESVRSAIAYETPREK